MNYKLWEPIEDTILKTWCDKESCEQLAQRLGRSVGSVKSRLQTLGIKKKNIYPKKTWTKEMERYLKNRAGKQSTKSIAKNLGVSIKALRLKASRLNVCLRTHKNRLWKVDEVDLLIKMIESSDSWSKVSKVLGKSPQSCRKKASELGLTLKLKVEWKTTELRYIHNNRLIGMSYKEISTHLNRTETSVRKRYARYKKEVGLN